MDYDDNDFQSQNLHLAGEGNNKLPPVLRPYALPRFDFDDNLHGHLRFDSFVETEVFLGFESSEDNQWIEDFSRGTSGIAFSSAAAEPCSISRHNNVWSEAASSESVEMLLKSVGQDEIIPGQIISKDSDACDELGCIIKQMEPSLKHGDSSFSEMGNDTQLQTVETPGKFSGLKGDVGGDHLLVENVSQTLEDETSVDGALCASDSIGRNKDLPVTEVDESKDGEQIVVNENQINASIDQSVDNRGQEDKFVSGSQADNVIPSMQNSCKSSSLIDSQDIRHLKNDITDENVDSLAKDDVGSSQDVHIGGNAEGTANHSEPSDRMVRGNSDQQMVEVCDGGLVGDFSFQTGKSQNLVSSQGKLEDLTPVPFVGDTTLEEHESEVSGPDTTTCMSLDSKMDIIMPIKCDAIDKNLLLESGPNTKTHSSESEKSLLLVEDGKGSKGESEGANDTLGAEPMEACDLVTEPKDDYNCDQIVSAAANLNTKLPSDCSNEDCGNDVSPLVKKRVDSLSLSSGSTVNELDSNLQSDVAASSTSVDFVHLTSGKDLHANAVSIQKEVQVSSSEASSSIMAKSSGMKTEKGAAGEIDEQFSHKKVDQPLPLDDTYNAENQSADQLLHEVTLDDGKDMRASSLVCDSTVRGTDIAVAQVISETSEASGAVLVHHNGKIPSNAVPSTSKEPSHDSGEIRLEETDPKSVSEEKISDHVAVHHDVDVTPDSQTKLHKIESGGSADLDSPSCGSPIVIRTSEQSQRLEKDNVKGSANQTASASGVINGEASKGQSISQDTKGNDSSLGDKSFTFEVTPLADLSDKEAGKNWQPFATVQHDKMSSVVDGTPSTSSLSNVAAKTAQDASHANPQASDRHKVRGGSKGTSERKTRRSGGKTAGKESSKKGTAAKETTPARQSERSDRISNVSRGSAGIGQLIQSNEMQHYGHAEVFHQPFTDLQQVQLRAQIFVYGALIQGVAPDEAYMISAFGGPDGGRTIWENAWRACVERSHGQKSHLVSPETPSQSRLGAKTSDQSIKQNALQSKVTASPASRSTSKGTPTTVVNPMIPLSSPLWSIPTPSGDALQPTGIPRGAVMEYQQGLSPLHPPPIRNFVGHNAPWMSQPPFRAPWVPHTSTFDVNARFPVLPMTEPVNLTPVREASVPHSSSMKQVSPVPTSQSGSPANIFAGTPLVDSKKATVTPGQHSADLKPRKRKKSAVSEDTGQIMWQLQTEQQFPSVVTSYSSTPAAITTPATIVSKSVEKFITTSSADHLKKGNQDSDQRATLSEETLSKLKEAQKQAEDASALAATAISHSQEIWNQLGKYKNSGLAPDIETKLTSATVAIAAAAAVAKAAAAAANVARNAGLQAKLMADEALVSISSSDSVMKLGKATPASILWGEDAMASSNSVIVAAREAARRRVEAASAASKQAENMDAIVKAAELAAEAVSQAGKIVAMGEPFSLTELVESGPNAYWKVPQPSPEPDGTIRDYIDKSANHGMSPTLREMARESTEDRTRVADGILGPAATSRRDKKGQKGRKASDIATTKGATSESEQGFGSPSLTTPTENENGGEVSKDSNLMEGSHVEVSRDGGGMKVAWFLADILNLKDGKAYVCYNELRSDDGERLKEWVEFGGEGDQAPRIRSTRPITGMPFEGTRKRRRAAMGDYNWSVGDRVDAWMQDRWWEGVVTEKNKKDETSFMIHFPAQGETSVVKEWLLRPSLIWKNGSWIEWSSSGGNNSSSHEGDTPQEKRLRTGSPAVEAKGKNKLSKAVDTKDSGKPDDMRLLDLSASDRIFNIGKSTSNASKPGPLRMIGSGLQKEGSRVIFGVPKPGKKRKFMEVSKHYFADQSKKTNETSDSAKFTKYLMPQGFGNRGAKNKAETKDKRPVVSKPKVLKSGKPPTVSGRTIPQKDDTSNKMVSEPDDAVHSDASKLKDSVSNIENISGKHNMMESRSFSSSDGGAAGPVLFSSVAMSSDAPSKKSSTSNAKSERINKGKQATTAGKMTKTEEEKAGNDNSTKTVSEVEPRRSNRRIQPTSRLLEGLQSSLITSKIPSIAHDKSHKSQSKSSKGNTHG